MSTLHILSKILSWSTQEVQFYFLLRKKKQITFTLSGNRQLLYEVLRVQCLQSVLFLFHNIYHLHLNNMYYNILFKDNTGN